MGVGKTERASLHDSRFTIGRRSDAANDRIIRNLKVKGGRIRKIGDKWTIVPAATTISPGVGYPSAWELTIDGDTATCINCMLMLSTITVMAAGNQMQLTCALTGGDGWLCGVINGSTKEISLDFRDPTTTMNEEQDEIVFPLYRVIKEVGVWRVAVDVRAMPRIGAYW